MSASCEVEGLLFRNDVAGSIRHRIGAEVEGLAVEGQRLVRSYLAAGIQDWTGETAEGVEGFSYARGMYASGSLWGKVRMAPNLTRGGDKERPYIIARVLESGGYGGHKGETYRTRSGRRRTRWVKGHAHNRKAIHEFRQAYRILKLRAAEVREDLTRDLDG
jgi:hypothetical protein